MLPRRRMDMDRGMERKADRAGRVVVEQIPGSGPQVPGSRLQDLGRGAIPNRETTTVLSVGKARRCGGTEVHRRIALSAWGR